MMPIDILFVASVTHFNVIISIEIACGQYYKTYPLSPGLQCSGKLSQYCFITLAPSVNLTLKVLL